MKFQYLLKSVLALHDGEMGRLTNQQSMGELVEFLYGQAQGERIVLAINQIIHENQNLAALKRIKRRDLKKLLSQRDVFLICYGDQVQELSKSPLKSLVEFLGEQVGGIITCLHLLPFFPYSSDDGFSVIDYYQVERSLGDWDDIKRLDNSYRLMFDAVINHISAKSNWFKQYKSGNKQYQEYFIELDKNSDLSQVIRPRALPVLTPFNTLMGEKYLWTTFSKDQIDLNYQNPSVLLEVIKILLFYISWGAEFIRLDAIAYLWKELGTSCIHLPQTHAIVQLFRVILDEIAPWVCLITETNVPHRENISYFGDGWNEAQLVYNFALPPLLLHTFLSGQTEQLSRWAKTLNLPSNQVTFFNFLASHDGIGITPLLGIVSAREINELVEVTQQHGGFISYKSNADGSQSPYELNINYFDALSNPNSEEPLEIQINRFITAHAIMFSIIGVPAIYFHSLFGSRSWKAGVEHEGHKRAINRRKLTHQELESDLQVEESLRSQVFSKMVRLLKIRSEHSAFHPLAKQDVVEFSLALFAVQRTSLDGCESILCVHNVTGDIQSVRLNLDKFNAKLAVDLIHQTTISSNQTEITIKPYSFVWLKLSS